MVGRLRKDAALFSLPGPRPAGRRGRPRIYGEQKLSLARWAAHRRGWEEVECEQYGRRVVKTIKTFEATWRPAGGAIRVVVVKEESGWLAFFSTKADATAVEVLEAAADRNALEQTFKTVKEVWGRASSRCGTWTAARGAST